MNGIDLTEGTHGPQVIAAAMIFTTMLGYRLSTKTLTPASTVLDLDTAAKLANGLAGRIHNLAQPTRAEHDAGLDEGDPLEALGGEP